MAHSNIRRATQADVAALTSCIAQAYAPFQALKGLPDVTAGLTDDVENNFVFVAESTPSDSGDAREIVGGAVLVLQEGIGHLANVAVIPSASGIGLCRALLDRVEDTCRSHGITHLRLATHVEMASNVALYQHLGWVEVARANQTVHMDKHLF